MKRQSSPNSCRSVYRPGAILDPIAAAIVGFMAAKMGWEFGWDALHDLMDRSIDDAEIAPIRGTLEGTPGIQGEHDIRAQDGRHDRGRCTHRK
jgi:divalent metal cation (Fe/Co/Zn/Cd) transporter